MAASKTLTTLFVNTLEEMPALNPERLVIVGLPGNEWLAVLMCPCGCGVKIQLNLLPKERPRWSHLTVGNLTTMSPSVQQLIGCKSHFWINNGEVRWCNR